MSRDLVRACAIGRAATLRRGPGPAGVRADGLFSPAGWDTPTWAQATCGGRVPTCRANACGGRPAATSVSRPASAHGLRKSGQTVPGSQSGISVRHEDLRVRVNGRLQQLHSTSGAPPSTRSVSQIVWSHALDHCCWSVVQRSVTVVLEVMPAVGGPFLMAAHVRTVNVPEADRRRPERRVRDKGTPAREVERGLSALSDLATHKHPAMRAWLNRHPRVQLHFTATSGTWLNLVEAFFSTITRKALRRGNFPTVAGLIAAIERFIAAWNDRCRPFTWTKDPDTVIAKATDSRHRKTTTTSVTEH